MADTKTVNTGNTTTAGGAPAPLGAYPHAKRAGDLLFLSGIGPRAAGGGPIPGTGKDADGNVITTDIEAQCHAVFANVRSVLESAGAAWEDLVDITVYLTDIGRDFHIYNRVYAEYFRASDGPCRTTVEVSRLPSPIAIELKCIAKIG
ncbi:MAG: RidA family protein [Gammaproteobacteria bacterium]|nr:RidA family protein [Gammaproteobacteria bacterium]